VKKGERFSFAKCTKKSKRLKKIKRMSIFTRISNTTLKQKLFDDKMKIK